MNHAVLHERRLKTVNAFWYGSIAIAGTMILLWIPLGIFLSTTRDATGMVGFDVTNVQLRVLRYYPMVLAVLVGLLFAWRKRLKLLAVLIVVLWLTMAATIITLCWCEYIIRNTDPTIADRFEHSSEQHLVEAIARGDLQSIQDYLKSGKQINFMGERGVNPLYVAIFKRQWAAAEMVVNTGYDVRLKPRDLKYYGPRYVFSISRKYNDNAERLKCLRLLINAGLRPDITVGGDNLLEMAIKSDDPDGLSEILAYVRKMPVVNVNWSSCIQLAIQVERWSCGRLLLPFLDANGMVAARLLVKQNIASHSHGQHERDRFIADLRALE